MQCKLKRRRGDLINLRPHRLLCTFNFIGLGYSEEFVSNFQKIKARLEEGAKIKINKGVDDVCKKCPRSINQHCRKESTARLDANHSTALQLNEGDIVTWNAMENKIKNSITKEVLYEICAPCEWKMMCAEILETKTSDKS